MGEDPGGTDGGKLFLLIYESIIILSTIFPVYLSSENCGLSPVAAYRIEFFFDLIFTFDICIRYYACRSRRFFFCAVENWFDLISGPFVITSRVCYGPIYPVRGATGRARDVAEVFFKCFNPLVRLLKMLRR